MMPAAMRVAVISDGALELEERPIPSPVRGEVLIRVRAAASTAPTCSQRAGRYPPPAGAPQDIPGLECAGEVACDR